MHVLFVVVYHVNIVLLLLYYHMIMMSSDSTIIHLQKEKELKIVVREPDDKIFVELIDGSAEIFGSQLLVNNCYEFSYFSAVSIYTFDGCSLKIKKEASKSSTYEINTSKHVPKLIDIYNHLENLRIDANVNNTEWPVTLVVGPTDSGKSTLCRFLLNYAVKKRRTPIFIDLDVGQGSLSLTGTLGILSVEEPSDVYGRFNERAVSVYYLGYNNPGANIMFYRLLQQKLAKSLENRLNESPYFGASGAVINTCGWTDGGGYKLIKDSIRYFNVDVVLVLCQNSLYHRLKRDISHKTKVLFVPRLKGTVTRNKTVRMDNRNSSVKEYFYGLTGLLQPYTIKVSFKDLQIFKPNCSSKMESHISYSHNKEHSNIISVPIEPDILFHIFGLSYAEHVEDILLSSVYGFVCIVEMDMESEMASVLTPQPGPLPTKYLLMGDIMLTVEENNNENAC